MSILLYRLDERLLHGQVVVGWAGELQPNRYIVIDDGVSRSEWEQELYGLVVPADVETLFVSVEEARTNLTDWRDDPVRTLVLLRDVDSVRRLLAGGDLDRISVNLGGLYSRPGRKELLPFLHVDLEERGALTTLHEEGVTLFAQDLPSSTPVPWEALIG